MLEILGFDFLGFSFPFLSRFHDQRPAWYLPVPRVPLPLLSLLFLSFSSSGLMRPSVYLPVFLSSVMIPPHIPRFFFSRLGCRFVAEALALDLGLWKEEKAESSQTFTKLCDSENTKLRRLMIMMIMMIMITFYDLQHRIDFLTSVYHFCP